MALVQRTDTYPGSAREWVRSRFNALVRACYAAGVPFALALPMSRAILASWALETGWGREEHNSNAGNVHKGSWQGDTYESTDDGATVEFRAYEDIDQAAADAVRLASHAQYRDAWAYLARNPDDVREWYRRMLTPLDGSAGYHPLHDGDLDSIESIYNRLPRRAA